MGKRKIEKSSKEENSVPGIGCSPQVTKHTVKDNKGKEGTAYGDEDKAMERYIENRIKNESR